LRLDDLQSASALFERDAVGMTVEQALAARDVLGGTAPSRVAAALAEARQRIDVATRSEASS
jgi:argininosuccinate lyase